MFRPPNSRGGAFDDRAAAQGVLDGARLLEDFLEHEVREVAALGVFGAEFQLADLHVGRVRAEVLNVEAFAREGRHVVVVEINDLARVGDDGVASLARKFSPSPMPTISGEPRRAPTIMSG